MHRPLLRPVRMVLLSLRAVWAQPLSLAAPLLVAVIIGMTAATGLAGAAVDRPLVLAISGILSWAACAWSVQAVAAGLWQLGGGERIPTAVLLRSGLRSLPAALRSGTWCAALVALGVLALLIGAAAGWALGLWALVAAVLEEQRGRELPDRAWQLAGAGGVLFALLASILAVVAASYVVLGLRLVLDEDALLLYPPLASAITIPLITCAFLARRAPDEA